MQEKNVEIAKYLLENGADVNAKLINGCNALHMAVEKGDEDLSLDFKTI